jgi:hypothetical protein
MSAGEKVELGETYRRLEQRVWELAEAGENRGNEFTLANMAVLLQLFQTDAEALRRIEENLDDLIRATPSERARLLGEILTE